MADEKKKTEEKRIDSSQIFYCEVCKKVHKGEEKEKCGVCGGILKEVSDAK